MFYLIFQKPFMENLTYGKESSILKDKDTTMDKNKALT